MCVCAHTHFFSVKQLPTQRAEFTCPIINITTNYKSQKVRIEIFVNAKGDDCEQPIYHWCL